LKFFLKQISLIGIDENSLHNYAPQTWTLKTEMIVSAFVPFMILIARYRVTWLAVFTFILIFLFQVSYFIMLFSMGIILAVYMPEVNKYMEGKSRGFKVSVLLAGLCLYSYRFSIVPYFHEGSFLQNVFGDGDQAGLPWGFFMNLMIGFGVVLILAISLNSATLKSILHHSIMRLLGRISYSIYLCHYLLLILIIPRIVLMLNNAGMSDRSTIILIAFLSTLALTFGLSYLLYYTVERFGMSMGKKVISLYAATFNKAKSYK
jgi:peptidoglycan/LPS O-acetylase OafA/YrhL